ncbi:MAG: hypothetical protein JW976_00830 [Syntrophaceae bacterium]|nr:hypothetical protein [Syntrophaceae bacterium]
MGFLDFLKMKKKQGLYTGGDGETIEKAIIINAKRMTVGIPAEYRFVEEKYGRMDLDWTFELQAVMRSGNRQYDVLAIKLKDGQEKTFFFDITKFYGKF